MYVILYVQRSINKVTEQYNVHLKFSYVTDTNSLTSSMFFQQNSAYK